MQCILVKPSALLLLSLHPLLLRQFHLWESDLTEKALIPLALLLLVCPDFFFLSGRGRMAQHFESPDCLGIHLLFGVSLWLSNSWLGGGMVCQMPFQWGTQLFSLIPGLLQKAQSNPSHPPMSPDDL